jgi:hypothetical protein
MLFGDAKKNVDAILVQLSSLNGKGAASGKEKVLVAVGK